jgi:hypothetical protein
MFDFILLKFIKYCKIKLYNQILGTYIIINIHYKLHEKCKLERGISIIIKRIANI